jgi:hypothetical protein
MWILTVISFVPLFMILLLNGIGFLTRQPLRRSWLTIAILTLVNSLLDWLMLASLPWMGLSFGPQAGSPLFVFHVTRLIFLFIGLVGLILMSNRSKAKYQLVVIPLSLVQIVLSLLAFDGMYIEPFRLTTTEVKLNSQAFEPGHPLTIVHLTDLHFEHVTRREEAVLAQLDTIQPDLILLTGDYVSDDYVHDPVVLEQTQAFLSLLSAPYGVYAITGATDYPDVVPIFEDLPIRLLDNEVEVLNLPMVELALVGVSHLGFDTDRRNLERLMRNVPNDVYTILLYHTPDLIETASTEEIDLYLAGHTHGGQVRLPFYGALITFSRYGKQYEMGQFQVGETTLYVSRGLGMDGTPLPRVRFLCPPEVVVFELGE